MGRRSRKRRLAVVAIAGFALLVAACTSTVRASVASDGTQSDDHSFDASLSNDGRYVAFQSYATNLVSGDTNARADVFVRDNTTKTVTRVSVTSSGQQGNRDAATPRLDATGRYVAFISQATNFGGIGANNVFVRDTQANTTQYIGWADSAFDLAFSADARYVAFPENSKLAVYDRTAATLDTSAGAGVHASLSSDGHYVAFARQRPGTGTDPITNPAQYDVFVRDRTAQTTAQVPYPAPKFAGDAQQGSHPSISGSGRYVAYTLSEVTDPDPFNGSSFTRAYVYDRQTGALTRADVPTTGSAGYGTADAQAISADGRYVMFMSSGALAPDSDGSTHEFVRDRVGNRTYLVDRDGNEVIANGLSTYGDTISADGAHVAFATTATNLVPNDTNGKIDVFVRAFPGGTP